MGLLDDAIREHLDLKRRRGADPAEVERDEREALGPVRRGPESEQAPEEPAAYDLEAEPDWDGPYDDEAEDDHEAEDTRARGRSAPPLEFDSAEEPTRLHQPPSEPEPDPRDHEGVPPEPEARRGRTDFEDPFRDDPFAEDAFTEAERPASPPPHPAPGAADDELGGETVEYRVEDAFDEPAEGEPHGRHPSRREGKPEGEEDVLEETPEFLQDTPDHDRLWFEQRPPRDFDFDG